MSALIKSGGTPDLRIVGLGVRSAAQPPVPKADPEDLELARLRAEIVQLKNAVGRARSEKASAVEEAHEVGRLAGLAEADHREEARFRLLQEGLGAAGSAFSTSLDRLECLAPQLVRVALEKLFTSSEDWAPMVSAMVERQLATLRRASVIAIHVSPADFTSVEDVLTGDAQVSLDAGLRAGAARIECRLGQIDLDVREQWAALATLLDAMAMEESA